MSKSAVLKGTILEFLEFENVKEDFLKPEILNSYDVT